MEVGEAVDGAYAHADREDGRQGLQPPGRNSAGRLPPLVALPSVMNSTAATLEPSTPDDRTSSMVDAPTAVATSMTSPAIPRNGAGSAPNAETREATARPPTAPNATRDPRRPRTVRPGPSWKVMIPNR